MIFVQAPPPDIQLEIRVEAREVRTEVDGKASLTVRAEPDGGSVDRTVRASPTGDAAQARNVRVVTRAEARIADPRVVQPLPVTALIGEEIVPAETPKPDRR